MWQDRSRPDFCHAPVLVAIVTAVYERLVWLQWPHHKQAVPVGAGCHTGRNGVSSTQIAPQDSIMNVICTHLMP